MKQDSKMIWSFLGDGKGSFRSVNADNTSRLYFPLMNEAGMRCSITPELKGDIAGSFDKYLMPPVVTEDLHRTHNSRYFWLKAEGFDPWAINGLSPYQQTAKWKNDSEESLITARPGSFKLERKHPLPGLEAEMTVFVPATKDKVELWKVCVRNSGEEIVKLKAYAALPLFGRHADNLRDHRQVTTMFQKCYRDENGVRIKPTIVHDEKGHQHNKTSYFVYGYGENGEKPDNIWTRIQDFIGEGGSLNNPKAVFTGSSEPKISDDQRHGNEAVGAFGWDNISLNPGEERSFVVVIGITEQDDSMEIAQRYSTVEKLDETLEKTHTHWNNLSSEVSFKTGRSDFDEWAHWLAFQLKCRQIYGNSFLPDFGYGRGGRGWRDLWQDSLSIFLVDPDSARDEIVNNLKGIRIDGSNATIIGNNPGEFKADRNNIPRTWCDHGAWPLFALDFYIQQTGDLSILLEKIPYWKDQFTGRSTGLDKDWNPDQGSWLKTIDGQIYEGTVLEHVLVQQLSAFFNVGEHNILKLEGADWNDTLDMARTRGESVCFQSFYAGNLKSLTELLSLLKNRGETKIKLLKEITFLLDTLSDKSTSDYNSIEYKRKALKLFFDRVNSRVSGEESEISIEDLIGDLNKKYEHSGSRVRENEWITTDKGTSFFNGHYDDLGRPMHGTFGEGIRMDLTSQVMPVMFNIADDNQIDSLYYSAREILGTPGSPGLRLCTRYPEIDMNIGRITGFVYGYKEHGSKWMQQNIMFMYGLFKRGKNEFGKQMFRDIYALSMDSNTAKTFPGIASYYDPNNQGAYMYLTGSSTWIFLTLVTQIFGIRGENGSLVLEPKLDDWFFDENGKAGINCTFQNKRLRISYHKNQEFKGSGKIIKAAIGDKEFVSCESPRVVIDAETLNSYTESLVGVDIYLS